MYRKWFRAFSARVRVASILIIIAVVAVAGYQVYDYYSDKVGYTPSKAIETYFTSLAQGNLTEVARQTYRPITDIYGRPVTEGEFQAQLKRLTGTQRLPFTSIESTRLFEREGARYYLVKLTSSVGGAMGATRVVVAVRRVDSAWVVVYPFPILLQG